MNPETDVDIVRAWSDCCNGHLVKGHGLPSNGRQHWLRLKSNIWTLFAIDVPLPPLIACCSGVKAVAAHCRFRIWTTTPGLFLKSGSPSGGELKPVAACAEEPTQLLIPAAYGG